MFDMQGWFQGGTKETIQFESNILFLIIFWNHFFYNCIYMLSKDKYIVYVLALAWIIWNVMGGIENVLQFWNDSYTIWVLLNILWYMLVWLFIT